MPKTPEEIDAIIDAAATGPASATVYGRSATQHNIGDLLDWRDRQANHDVGSNKRSIGIRLINTRPPGSV